MKKILKGQELPIKQIELLEKIRDLKEFDYYIIADLLYKESNNNEVIRLRYYNGYTNDFLHIWLGLGVYVAGTTQSTYLDDTSFINVELKRKRDFNEQREKISQSFINVDQLYNYSLTLEENRQKIQEIINDIRVNNFL